MSLEAVVGEGEGIGSSDEDCDNGGGDGGDNSFMGGLEEGEGESEGRREGDESQSGRQRLGAESSARAQGPGGNITGRAQGGLSWVTRRDKSTTVAGQQSTRKLRNHYDGNQGGVGVGQGLGQGLGQGQGGVGQEVDLMMPLSRTSDDRLNASFETDYGSAWGDITQGNITPMCNITPTSSSYDIASPLSSPYSPSPGGRGTNLGEGNNMGRGAGALGKSSPSNNHMALALSPRDALYYSSDEDEGEGRGRGGGGIGSGGLLGSDDNSSDDDATVASDSVLPEIFFGHRDRNSGQFNAKISFHPAEGGAAATHPFDPHANPTSLLSPGLGYGHGNGGGVGGAGGMPLADDNNPSHQTIKPPRTGGKGDRVGGGRGKVRY